MRHRRSPSPRSRRIERGDHGYIVVLLAMLMAALLVITALVIDFSLLRDDRRADQKVADAAATAAAVQLAATTSGRAACERALDSAIRNLPGVTGLSGADCSGFPTYCEPTTTSPATTTGTAGDYTLTIVHPVNEGHPYMTTGSAIGEPARSTTAGDGNRCRRVGVELSLSRAPSFGGVVDGSARTTTVHAVALASTDDGGPLPINLLILERTACDAIRVEGSGRLIIAPIVKGSEIFPGVLAVESDGTGTHCTGTSPSRGTLNVVSAYVRADGPTGCGANEITAGTGHGCGDITLYAPGVPGPASPGSCKNEAYRPACTTNSSGTLFPSPTRMGRRHTRGAIDHTFNCKPSYLGESWYSEHPVNPCFDSFENSDLDYVDELLGFVGDSGTPAGFTTYTGPCTIDGSTGPVTVPEGNVHVPCSTLFVKRPLTFEGGNVIFDGDVVIEAANGALNLHACGAEDVDDCDPADQLVTDPSDPSAWRAGLDYVETQYSSDAAWTVFRDGATIRKAGGAALRIDDSIVFFSEGAEYDSKALDLAGGAGSLRWWATREGPFQHMALWSDSAIDHHFAGQANLDLEGVFFAPVGNITYAGTGSQEQIAAQFITERLFITGSGELTIAPNTDRSITYQQARSTLIR